MEVLLPVLSCVAIAVAGRELHSTGMDGGLELTEFDRGMVVGALKTGKSVKDIVKILGLKRQAVEKFVADWEDGKVDPETGLYKVFSSDSCEIQDTDTAQMS